MKHLLFRTGVNNSAPWGPGRCDTHKSHRLFAPGQLGTVGCETVCVHSKTAACTGWAPSVAAMGNGARCGPSSAFLKAELPMYARADRSLTSACRVTGCHHS